MLKGVKLLQKIFVYTIGDFNWHAIWRPTRNLTATVTNK